MADTPESGAIVKREDETPERDPIVALTADEEGGDFALQVGIFRTLGAGLGRDLEIGDAAAHGRVGVVHPQQAYAMDVEAVRGPALAAGGHAHLQQRLVRLGLLLLRQSLQGLLHRDRLATVPDGGEQRLGGGDLTARAPRLGGGEIGDLGVAFNTIATQIAEREERLTELDRLKSEFVSSVSHELKTPLTTIKLLAHLLQQRHVTEEERLDFSKTIAIECDRQIDFVGNLLDLSRIESGAYKLRKMQVDVLKLISSCGDVERQRAQSLGLTLTTNPPAALPDVTGDFEALCRVIRSLIDNAIKYTPEGGHITISAREIDKTLVISVSDTGKGIPETDLPHIFDKFYRASEAEDGPAGSPATAASGVGLGLYLAQHIVSQLDGEMSVESKQGVGTTFNVILPLWIDDVAIEKTEENTHVKALVGS